MPNVGDSIGPYRLLQRIGDGATGTVFLAEKEGNVDRYAAKVFEPDTAARSIAYKRFVRESKILAKVIHPNLARVVDWIEGADESGCLIMQYVPGQTLSEILFGPTILPMGRVGQIVSGLANGLDHIHALRVVHRDIKPANIIVNRDEQEWVPTLVDFGAAKIINDLAGDITSPGEDRTAPNTLLYTSPEQCDQQEATSVSDVYSLGVVAVEMISGKTPFESHRHRDHLMMIRLSRPPLELSSLAPEMEFPPGLQAVITRVLMESPGERYQSAGEFASDLLNAFGQDAQRGAEQ
jgi:eukaryotic-like serine/threonine-protein kinase